MSLKKLGRYELVRVLGKGAMGVVYEGRDPNLDRRVAIKIVKIENLSEEAAAEYESRFRTEARSAARLQHPNIVSVYDADRDGTNPFLVMEYIQGEDLKYHLDRGVRYSLEQSLRMIRDLLSALDYAHKQGIVHRDVKPANLLIEASGRVKLTDFGVARIQDSGEATRTQGSMVGTLKYMAPEQVQGLKIDSRADLFSAGVVLYQLLTDKRPFDGDNDFSIIHQIIGQDPPPPSSINSRLPSAIDAVVARALAKDREQRFATARDFATALHSAMRRADDATVVPPADPFKKTDSAGSGSGGHQSSSGGIPVPTTPSVITQEVELVYWKDIKESTDLEDLKSFLEKFPAGIYADLARRRLRRLTGADTSPDQTVLTGVSKAGQARQQDVDATRVRTDPGSYAEPTLQMGRPADAIAKADSKPSKAGAGDSASAVNDSRFEEPWRMTGEATDAGTSRQPQLKPSTRKRPVALLVGAGVVLVAGLAVFISSGKKPLSSHMTVAQVSIPAPAVPASAPASAGTAESVPVSASIPASASVPASESNPASAGAAVLAASEPASAPARARPPVSASAPSAVRALAAASVPAAKRAAASTSVSAGAARPVVDGGSAIADAVPGKAATPTKTAVKITSTASSTVPDRPKSVPPVGTATAARQDSRAAAAGSALAAQNEVEACKERFFLMRERCLANACENAAVRSHPLCVTWRENKRLREESAARQNP